MKTKALVAGIALAIMTVASVATADRYTRATNDNPLRIVRYVVHPVGMALEYTVMRPIHWVVSQPNLDVLFGHKATTIEDNKYFEWSHGDFSPSIAEERPDTLQAPKPTKPADKK